MRGYKDVAYSGSDLVARITELMDENKKLRAALESLRITSHHECEDSWYSCPKAVDYCGEDDRNHCSCGMDKQNAIIDDALKGN